LELLLGVAPGTADDVEGSSRRSVMATFTAPAAARTNRPPAARDREERHRCRADQGAGLFDGKQ
jgi:hypothetical protein